MRRKNESRKIGSAGEDAAAAFLSEHGYEILERNFTVRGGEIDIIARKNEYLVFVEVKSRSADSWISGEQAVTYKKRRFIVRTAGIYYDRYKEIYGEAVCRFDVAAVVIENGRIAHMKYYVAAFDSGGV